MNRIFKAIREFFASPVERTLIPVMGVFPPPEDAWFDVTSLSDAERTFYNPARNEYRQEPSDWPVIDSGLIPLKED